MVCLFLSSSIVLLVGFAIVVAGTGSPGCGKTLPAGVIPGGRSANMSVTSGGLNRTYLIHLPDDYENDVPTPLILSYHGRTKDAAEQEELSQFSNSSYNLDWIAVYPQGVANSRGTRQWTGDPDAPTSINDILFTSDLITQLQNDYCINPNTIYAAGKSNGAGLVGLLACDANTSSTIAAFAPVSIAFYLNADNSTPSCNPSRSPVPILETHGWKDTTIPYLGGEDSSERGATIGIPEWLDAWAERDGLDPNDNQTSTLCNATGQHKVTRYHWDKEGYGEVLVHYNVSNLHHDWPSTYPNDDGNVTTCFDATRVIMEFFSKNAL